MNHPGRDLIEQIAWIADHNFDFVDLTYEPPTDVHYDPMLTRGRLVAAKLEAIGHTNPSLPAVYPIPAVKKACFDELTKAVEFFKEVGIDKMNVHPFYYAINRSPEELIYENIKLLAKLSDRCRELGIILMLENYITPFHSLETFERIKDEVPDLKIHLDIGHLNIEGDAAKLVEEFFVRFGPEEIIHLHLHDNKGEKDEHLPIGCGTIDWPSVIDVLKKFKYRQTATLEVFAEDRDYLLLSKQKIQKLWAKSS